MPRTATPLPLLAAIGALLLALGTGIAILRRRSPA
jgi:LPXTG-motif cell wall-anchored protein